LILGTTFKYDLQFNIAFREPVNIRDMAIGDTNNNGYDEIVCSAAGGFLFSYEYAAQVEVTEIFFATLIAYPAFTPVYSEVRVAEAEFIPPVDQTIVANATQIQQPIQPKPIYMVPIGMGG